MIPPRPESRNFSALLFLVLFLSWTTLPAGAAATAPAMPTLSGIPAPDSLFPNGGRPENKNHAILAAMLNLPYRVDGAINDQGQYTLFADQSQRFATPGLNCSGFVVAASRFLLQRNFTLDETKRDRLGDSGPGSPHGEDWDFGWDLLLNISEGLPRVALLPGGRSAPPEAGNGFAPRGYDIQDPATWRELPGRLNRGKLYLASFSVESRRKGYALQHYHVGLIHVAPDGKAWLYHNTGQAGKVKRLDLKSRSGQAAFRKAFANPGERRRMLYVIETKLP